MGLKKQVISPMPELLSYWLQLDDAQPLIRFLNEYTAELCHESEGHLLGLAAVPLQDVQAAIAELRYATTELGLIGVEIGSNINGLPIGDSRFDPFFAACAALDVPVFVHAIKPAGMDRLVGPPQLQQVLAYPTDVGLAAASVITGGLLTRYPKLRIAFSHGGGTLAMLLPRLQQGWKVFPALAESITESPKEQVKKMFFDTLLFDADALKYLAASCGTQGLMLGTDYPFNFQEHRPVERLADAGFDSATCAALAFGNARRFLGQSISESKEST
jgi:aminocarboxymuconate-semialdehyde decarboxylase